MPSFCRNLSDIWVHSIFRSSVVSASRPIVDVGPYLAAGTPAAFLLFGLLAPCLVCLRGAVFSGYWLRLPFSRKAFKVYRFYPYSKRPPRWVDVGQLTDNQKMSGISICCCCYSDVPYSPIFLPGWLLALWLPALYFKSSSIFLEKNWSLYKYRKTAHKTRRLNVPKFGVYVREKNLDVIQNKNKGGKGQTGSHHCKRLISSSSTHTIWSNYPHVESAD